MNSLLPFVKKILLDLARWGWNHSIGILGLMIYSGVVGSVSYLSGYQVGIDAKTTITQSSFGEHCIKQLADTANESGANVDFVPDTVQKVVFCGRPLSQEDSAVEYLRKYLSVFEGKCFSIEGDLQSDDLDVEVSLGGDILTRFENEHGEEIPFCRCKKEILPVIAQHKNMVCGNRI